MGTISTNITKQFGGAGRNRTDDLLLAKQALSQLSYGPPPKLMVGWNARKGESQTDKPCEGGVL